MWVLELVKLLIDFSFILPPADSEHGLKQTTGYHQSWQTKVFCEKVLQMRYTGIRAFTKQQIKIKVLLSAVKCMEIPVSKF